MRFSFAGLLNGRLTLLFALAATSVSAQVQDFVFTTSGPHHVVQGHYLFFEVATQVASGIDNEQVVPSVAGLPSGATADFVDMEKFCCGSTLYRVNGNTPVKISVATTTPAGTYPLTITYTTPGGLQRSTNFTLYVDPVPGPVSKVTPPADTPLASLAKWESNMTTYGANHCVASEMSSIYSGYVWFYDGIRVYHQIGDYTGDHATWDACAAMVTSLYQSYVLTNNGSIPGYYVFGKGLAMNYQRTRDLLSKQVVEELRANSAYASQSDVQYSIDWGRSREVAFGLEAHVAYESTGGPRNTPAYNDLVELIFGHFSQWFLDRNTPLVQPFMVALSAEALIEYWQQSQDPRVLSTLQVAADWLWVNSWDTSCQCFRYYDDTDFTGTYSLSQDLNLLIAPLYGWVFQQTGQQLYRDRGDAIFNSGVVGAYLGDVGVSGKQFSQNYRWSGKYVEWRSGALTSRNTPTVTITTPTSTAQWSTSVSSISLAGTASSLQGVTLVTWTSDHGGSGVATGTSTWSANDIALQIGSNQITVTAVDTAGSAASVVLTVTYSSPDTAVPNADLVLPSDGRGTAQTFTFVFSDSQSATNLAAAAMLFAPVLDGQNSCFVIYFQNQGTIQLEWDDVTGNEIKPAGSSGTLQNSQCAIGATSVSATALSTTITLDITFKSAFTGLKNIYMYGADGDGSINTGWVKMGTYEVADSPASDTAIRFQ